MTQIFTAEQEEAIQNLRDRMKTELPQEIYEDDIYIYRFLKARDFNLKQSEIMLRKHVQFRKAMQIDTILTDFKPSEVFQKYISKSCFGFDKEGFPVRYCTWGAVDLIGLFKSNNAYNYLKFVFQILETDLLSHKKQSEKTGRSIFQTVFIFNTENLSLSQVTNTRSLQVLMKASTFFQDNYPEVLKRIYVINASMYYTMAYNVIKAILAPVVRDKFQVYGRTGWKEELRKTIDVEVLPAFLGGNRTDPDGNPLCLTCVNHAGIIPESYYLKKNIAKTAGKPGMKYIRLEKLETACVTIDIDKPRSRLHWEFELKSYDIGFGLKLEAINEEQFEELLPIFKIETELEPICGMYRCKKMGKYSIVFDNSHSWFHHKEIYYRTWVTGAEDI